MPPSDHEEAIGRVAECCAEFNDPFRSFLNEDGHRFIDVPHRGKPKTIFAPRGASVFTVIDARRLTNKSERAVQESSAIDTIESDLESRLIELEAEHSPTDLEALTQPLGEDGPAYFDGVRAQQPLYVYAEDFGPDAFDRCLTQVGSVARLAFNDALEMVGVELDDIDDAMSQESEEPDSLAFY